MVATKLLLQTLKTQNRCPLPLPIVVTDYISQEHFSFQLLVGFFEGFIMIWINKGVDVKIESYVCFFVFFMFESFDIEVFSKYAL